VAQSDPAQPVLHGLKLAAVRQARIHGSLLPGQTVRLEAELLARMGGLVQARVRASLGARILMEAEVALGGSPVALA
jgi:3-hydroxymyristoyl/3-hydroxydecanoyl-(acyl carrier protein) dehydratase